MSKDKGTKNQKKAPADKTSGKTKSVSAYKLEGKKASSILPIFIPKPDTKTDKATKV